MKSFKALTRWRRFANALIARDYGHEDEKLSAPLKNWKRVIMTALSLQKVDVRSLLGSNMKTHNIKAKRV